MISQSASRALHGLFFLALADAAGEGPHSLAALAEASALPRPFLAKVFQELVRRHLLVSFRGRRGGYTFARDPSAISLLEVIEAVDGPGLSESCLLGLPACDEDNPCVLHSIWKAHRGPLVESMGRLTVADLLTDPSARRLALAARGR